VLPTLRFRSTKLGRCRLIGFWENQTRSSLSFAQPRQKPTKGNTQTKAGYLSFAQPRQKPNEIEKPRGKQTGVQLTTMARTDEPPHAVSRLGTAPKMGTTQNPCLVCPTSRPVLAERWAGFAWGEGAGWLGGSHQHRGQLSAWRTRGVSVRLNSCLSSAAG
jgi:hypothetical protein